MQLLIIRISFSSEQTAVWQSWILPIPSPQDEPQYSPPAISHSTIPTFITPSSFRNGGIPHGLSSALRLANPSLHKYSTFPEKNPPEFSRKSIRNLVNLREMYVFFSKKRFRGQKLLSIGNLWFVFLLYYAKGAKPTFSPASPRMISICATCKNRCSYADSSADNSMQSQSAFLHRVVIAYEPHHPALIAFKINLGIKKDRLLRLSNLAAHPSSAYCCFLSDLTRFTPTNRTRLSRHRKRPI